MTGRPHPCLARFRAIAVQVSIVRDRRFRKLTIVNRIRPCLLLIPGMLNTQNIWGEVVERLEDHVDVCFARVDSQDSIEQMANDAWRELDDVPMHVPVFVGGFSMGGYVALAMLARLRRPISGVALVSTSARSISPATQASRAKATTLIQHDYAGFVDGVVRTGTHSDYRANPDHVASLRTMMLRMGPRTAVRQNRAIAQRSERLALLASIDIPVSVVCGKEDRVVSPMLSEELAAGISRGTFTPVEGAGHFVLVERPQAVAEALQRLLGATGTVGK